MITIFTPTYNRAHTLPRLFESLKSQTSKTFEWLIVDDGSTDHTERIVEQFVENSDFEIRYLKQENKGKHFAINKGLQFAKGDYFLNIDSDDYLVNNAVSEIENLAANPENKKYAGFSFIHFADDISIRLAEYGQKAWEKPEVYVWKQKGEMMYCIKTEIYRMFPFPEFEGEKFCPESLVLSRIERQYQILYTDKVLVRGAYLEDGLSVKFYKLLHENPHGSLLSFKEKIQDEKNSERKLQLAKNYYDVAWKSPKTTIKEKYFSLPASLTFSVLLDRFSYKK